MRRDLMAIRVGEEFERWTVKETPYNNGPYTRAMAVCECKCGTIRPVQLGNLVSGASLSCGCLNREVNAAKATHGASRVGKRERLYSTWAHMVQRCTDKNDIGFKHYGGRGITVCAEWREYVPFMEWARANGYKEDLTIERIDFNGNYCPENCTWIPRTRQSKNRRDTRMLTAFGETKCIADWAEDPRCKIGRYALINRVVRGWLDEEAITSPKQNKWSRAARTANTNS